MLFAVFTVCVLELGLCVLLLVCAGTRLRFSSRLIAIALAAGLAYGSGRLAALLWSPPASALRTAELFVFAVTLVVIVLQPVWNPVGQVFFGGYVSAALAYLIFAGGVTVAGGLSPIATVASALLFLLEAWALLLTASFAFETCDVLCRTRHSRRFFEPDPDYLPFVSLQIPAYNEPPEMLIETIATAERLDYPDFEIVVVDNNTTDPAVWQPVSEYCRDRPRVRFAHVEQLDGYKSGALNLAMRSLTDDRATIVGVIDSDYLIDPRYLRDTVGHFADPSIAFVQTPQDYREYEGDPYFTACYDAYGYFFTTSMPSRNERNAIIFAGTMDFSGARRSTRSAAGTSGASPRTRRPR
jgi:hypothetical protein